MKSFFFFNFFFIEIIYQKHILLYFFKVFIFLNTNLIKNLKIKKNLKKLIILKKSTLKILENLNIFCNLKFFYNFIEIDIYSLTFILIKNFFSFYMYSPKTRFYIYYFLYNLYL